MPNVAINGFGRIGRIVFKLIQDRPDLKLVAVNDLFPPENLAYLLRHDTVYGKYEKDVTSESDRLVVAGKDYPVLAEKDPSRLPWSELDVDLVFECTGVFNKRRDLEKHLQAGADYVLLSSPAKSDDVPTVVHGVNAPNGDSRVVSCASCTTNCIAPIMEILGRRIGVHKAALSTVHAYTSTQSIVDGPNKKTRRGRAAAANIVPSTTGAAVATTKALPEHEGRFDGVALRVPLAVGSIADVVALAKRRTTVDEINAVFREEAETERYRGILQVTEEPLVSSDIIKEPYASVVDAELTQVIDGDLVKVLSWYDNEWGYATQMVREAGRLLGVRDISEARGPAS